MIFHPRLIIFLLNFHQIFTQNGISINCKIEKKFDSDLNNTISSCIVDIDLNVQQSDTFTNIKVKGNQHQTLNNTLKFEMEDRILNYFPKGFSKSLPNLRKIYAKNVNLLHITQENFMNLKGLAYLNLEENLIKFLGPNLFDKNSHLKHVNLKGNQINFIDLSAFKLDSTYFIDFSGGSNCIQNSGTFYSMNNSVKEKCSTTVIDALFIETNGFLTSLKSLRSDFIKLENDSLAISNIQRSLDDKFSELKGQNDGSSLQKKQENKAWWKQFLGYLTPSDIDGKLATLERNLTMQRKEFTNFEVNTKKENQNKIDNLKQRISLAEKNFTQQITSFEQRSRDFQKIINKNNETNEKLQSELEKVTIEMKIIENKNAELQKDVEDLKEFLKNFVRFLKFLK